MGLAYPGSMLIIYGFNLLAVALLVLSGKRKVRLRAPGVVFPAIVLLLAWLICCSGVWMQCLAELLSAPSFGLLMRFAWESLMVFLAQAFPVGIVIASNVPSKRQTAEQGPLPGCLRQNSYALTAVILYQVPVTLLLLWTAVSFRFFTMQNGGMIKTLTTITVVMLGFLLVIPLGGLLMGLAGMLAAYIALLAAVCVALSIAAAVTSAVRCGKLAGKKVSHCVLLSLVPVYNVIFLMQLRRAVKRTGGS